MQTQVSTKYQVVIPKQVRQMLQIKQGQKLNVLTVGGNIVLSPKVKWPESHLSSLRNLWKTIDIKSFVNQERELWS